MYSIFVAILFAIRIYSNSVHSFLFAACFHFVVRCSRVNSSTSSKWSGWLLKRRSRRSKRVADSISSKLTTLLLRAKCTSGLTRNWSKWRLPGRCSTNLVVWIAVVWSYVWKPSSRYIFCHLRSRECLSNCSYLTKLRVYRERNFDCCHGVLKSLKLKALL